MPLLPDKVPPNPGPCIQKFKWIASWKPYNRVTEAINLAPAVYNCLNASEALPVVGTYGGWAARVSGGRWTGPNAINQLRALDGNPSAVLYADGAHFWPHGLSQASEATSADEYVRNVRMVATLRQDMGR